MFNNGRTINRRKRRSLINSNSILIPTISAILVLTLVFTNVAVSSKTYKLISCNRQIETLNAEKKDLDEEKETLTSPTYIRDRAINELEMVDIENINELIEIQP